MPDIALDFLKKLEHNSRYLSGYVYFITDGNFVKIGIADRPGWRMAMLQTGNPNELTLLFTIPVPDSYHRTNNIRVRKLEKILHNYFKDHHVRGEWYDIKDQLDADGCRKIFGCVTERYFEKEAM